MPTMNVDSVPAVTTTMPVSPATLADRQTDQFRGAEHRHVALVLARGGGIMLRCQKCGRRVA